MISDELELVPLRFKSCYHVEIASPEQIFLFSEKKTYVLSGRIYALLAPLLKKGIHTADQMVEQLSETSYGAEIYYGLQQLEDAGYTERAEEGMPSEFAAFCQLMDLEPKTVLQKIRSCRVFVKGVGNVEIQPYVAALKALGITTQSSEPNFTLMVTEDYLHPDLEIAQKEIAHPWMIVKPKGTEAWLGPIIHPGQEKTWHCLASRVKQNQIESSYVKNKAKRYFSTFKAALSCTQEMVVQFAILELFKWIASPQTSPLNTKLLSLNMLSMKIEDHAFTPFHNSQQPVPLTLNSRKKEKNADGGSRSCSPEETFKKLAHLISPILGIVSTLKYEKFNEHFHVYSAGHNFAVSNAVEGVNCKSLRSTCAGKGQTEPQAKASCLCEGIERYCGLFQGHEARIKSSFYNLEEAILPSDCLLYSENQYENRFEINKISGKMHEIPLPYSKEMEIEWSPVWSMTNRIIKYLPTQFCYYAVPGEYTICRGDSNGCAAGNNLEEAILQGFFELVERDAIAIWWYNRIQMPRVDLNCFQEPYFQALVQEYKAMQRDVWVLDITSDLNIPTFVAISRKLGQNEEQIMFGFGCHLDPKIAASRALTEMNQFVTFLPGIHNNYQEDELMIKWIREATLENQPYLQGLLTTKTYAKYIETDNLLEDIEQCRQMLEKQGLEMLVLNQSRLDIDLKVVKVIIPGLRHFWPRFAPGRLYNVPVKMGLLDKPLHESELNPIPIFI